VLELTQINSRRRAIAPGTVVASAEVRKVARSTVKSGSTAGNLRHSEAILDKVRHKLTQRGMTPRPIDTARANIMSHLPVRQRKNLRAADAVDAEERQRRCRLLRPGREGNDGH
jgi:hypothetical protein